MAEVKKPRKSKAQKEREAKASEILKEIEASASAPNFTAERTSAEQVMIAASNIAGMMAQHPDLPYGAESAVALMVLGISMLHEMTPPEHKDLQKVSLDEMTSALWQAAVEVADRYEIQDLATFAMIVVRFDQSQGKPEAREAVLKTTDPWVAEKCGLDAIKVGSYYSSIPKMVTKPKTRKKEEKLEPEAPKTPLKIVKPPSVH